MKRQFVPTLFTALALALIPKCAAKAEVNPVQPREGRYAVILDTTLPEANRKSEHQNALRTLSESLQKTGIPRDHIQLYTSSAKAPTLKIMEEVFAPKSWAKKQPAEIQVYITANALSNGTADMLVPAGVSPDEIQETTDPRLISFNEIREMLASCGAERIFLMMNFMSVKNVTRSSGKTSALQNVNLERYRGVTSSEYFDEEEEDAAGDVPPIQTQNADSTNTPSVNQSGNFQFLQIVTRDQSVSNPQFNAFYQTFQSGLEGYADIAGNNDGWIQAEEIAYYLRANAAMDVEISRNGNARYVLCKAGKKAKIPASIFHELSRVFTRDEFTQERESAAQRAAAIENQEK